jgi:anti-sigma28 factor (negative regulator of flagellin synthesis)
MKIGKNPSIGIEAYKKEAAAGKKQESTKALSANQDAVALSLSAKSALTSSGVPELSDANRSDKLAKIKSQVSAGSYYISSTDIAKSIVGNLFG